MAQIRGIDPGKQERTNHVDDEVLHASLTERIKNSRDIQQICQEQRFTFIDTSENQDEAIIQAFTAITKRL